MSSDEDAVIKGLKAKADQRILDNQETPKPISGPSSNQFDKDNQELLKSSFRLKIYSPYRVYYEDIAQSVSGENETGPFDVLKNHKNFLTLLPAGELTVRNYRGKESIKINRGVMHVKSNTVTVFLDV